MNTITFSAQESATHCSCGIRSAALLLASPIISVCDYVSGPEGGREGGRERGRNTISIVLTRPVYPPKNYLATPLIINTIICIIKITLV